jgi:DNA-binding winged helix-turn-helix (wHTH) protein/tetratricopeptide (TPR) repeat protein
MSDGVFEFGEFRFLPSTRELWRAGQRVTLPRRTFECIEHLIAHRDRAVGRDELVTAIFGRPNVSDAQLGQIVLRARRAVDDDGNVQHTIRTIAGYGYRWVAATRAVEAVRAGEENAEEMPPSDRPPAADASLEEPVRSQAPPASAAAPPRRRVLVRRRRLAAVAAAAAIVVAAILAIAPHVHREQAPAATALPAGSVVVLPLQVDGLREDAWIRLGAMDLVAERLREAGLSVPPSESVLGLLSAATSPADSADIVRRNSGAQTLVRGHAVRKASGWHVRLAATADKGIEVPVEFDAQDAVQAARGAADLLLSALGRRLPADGERDAGLDETLQRARAAMLANELDTARSILRDSPQLAAAPAQLAYRLAQVDYRAGQLDRAKAALDDVLARPEAQTDVDLRARTLIARGATRMRLGAFADGGRDFDAALIALGDDGALLERGQALLGRGNSRVAEHRFDEALSDFGHARTDLEGAGDMFGVARVDANLGMLELYRGRPAAALGYLPGAADRFQSFGALHELLLTLTGLMEAQLAMLQRDAAWATVERAAALRERITDPDQRIDLLLNRAQVLAGFGRYREAQAALTQAAGIAMSGNRVLLARQRALNADLAARLGRWSEADEASSVALAEWPSSGADGDRASVLLVRQRALLALGRDDFARGLLDRSRAVPATPAETPGSVAEALAMAEWLHHAHEAERSAQWFRFAAASADRRGVPAEIVAVAAAWAPLLLDAGATDEAAAAIGRVAPWSAHDFDCALLQLRLFHALGQRDAWLSALRQAQALAGDREIPAAMLIPRVLDGHGALQLSGPAAADATRRPPP